jgi:hypothetical protein
VAIVGDGFGSIIVYTTLRYVGFRPDEITIYGDSDDPVKTYAQFAYNLGQTVLRSESESHFLPADWPTFAQLHAWAHRSPGPLIRSMRRKYNPGVPEILSEVAVVQRRLDWNGSRYPKRIGWLQREWDGMPHFVLYDEEANYAGRAKHVMLALGHGPLTYPPVLAKARENPEMTDRIVQAYEAKSYAPGGRYVVIGAGIASVNEWSNAIESGAKVISLLRTPDPDEQDLNTPRCLFEALGLDVYQGLSFDERVAFLGKILKGTSPKRRTWRETIETARAQGNFDQMLGEIDEVRPGPAGLQIHVTSRYGPDPGWLDVTGVVAGTGFNKSALTLPLLRRLIEHYNVPIEKGLLKLKTNCGVPGVDIPESRLCMMGIFANTIITHGDTIAGLKYIGRRFVGDVARAERRKRGFFSRAGMQLSLASACAKALRHVRPTEQLA